MGIYRTDTDNDGVCESVDICPGGNDNLDTDSDGNIVDAFELPPDEEWSVLGIVTYYEDGSVTVDVGAAEVTVDLGAEGGIWFSSDGLGELIDDADWILSAEAGIAWDEEGIDVDVNADVAIGVGIRTVFDAGPIHVPRLEVADDVVAEVAVLVLVLAMHVAGNHAAEGHEARSGGYGREVASRHQQSVQLAEGEPGLRSDGTSLPLERQDPVGERGVQYIRPILGRKRRVTIRSAEAA